MSEIPDNLLYATSHEWSRRLDGDIIEIGISDYAQESLGDVVYIELPEVGQIVSAATECCSIESVKAASDIYAPVSGEIVEINENLDDEPELLNESPYEKGWMFKIKASNIDELNTLLSSDSYLSNIDE